MIKKLYKKLYIYTLAVLVVATLLTTVVMNSISGKHFEKHFKRLPFSENLTIIKLLIQEARENDPPKIKEKVDWLNKKTKWDISYWQGEKCLYHCIDEHLNIKNQREYQKFRKTGRPEIIHREKNGPILISYLTNSYKENNFIMVSLNNFPPRKPPRHQELIPSSLLILLFLGLLLIPYTRFVIKPFQELLKSIKYISDGNFNKLIPTSEKSEFREIAETMNNMTLKIKEMITQKERMIADVSHELRTPLAKIRLALELLLKEEKGNKKYIELSISETENLDRIINDLLDSSELELNSEKFKLETVDFREILNENLEKNQLLFQENNLAINKFFPEKPLPVKLERVLFERVFNNIFSNISKYGKDSPVDIILTERENKMVLQIRDYGPGVKEEHLNKIFEPFYRTDESRTRKTGGRGLGLAIVKNIIEFHQGKVSAILPEDQKNGLILKIELPLQL